MTMLNYDSQGFIVGLGRVENNTRHIHDDTQEIIRILMAQHQIGESRLQEMNHNLRKINRSLSRLPAHVNVGTVQDFGSKRQQNRTPTREYGTRHPRQNSQNNVQNTVQGRSQNNQNRRDMGNRLRDSNGQFASQSEDSKQTKRLADTIKDSVGENLKIDDRNIDPLIDSFNEVKDVLSPLTSAFGALSDRAKERREKKHAKNVEDSLEDIAENTGGNSSGNGGRRGLPRGLGGLASGALSLAGKGGKGLLKGLGKVGGKRLGILGALIGAGTLASEWGDLDTEGKSAGVGGLAGGAGGAMAGATAGAMIGSVVPVVGTAVGGVVGSVLGGWLGSEGGEALGKTASPYIQNWTQGMTNANAPKKMNDTFSSGLDPFFKGAKDIWDWIKDKASGIMGVGSTTAPINDNKGFSGAGAGGEIGGGTNPMAGQESISAIVGGKQLKITSGFGHRHAPKAGASTYHNGLDLAAPEGTPIYAVEDGVFTTDGSANSKKGGGLQGRVKGRSGYTYGTAHLSKIVATQGQQVKAGDLIAYSGNSGNSTGAHIHYTLKNPQGVAIDPRGFKVPSNNTGTSIGNTTSSGLKGGGNTNYDSLITASALRHGIDPALMKAQIHTESGFNPNARSPVGAMGLGQLMPDTAKRFGVKNAWNPAQNIEGMAKYMAYLKKMFPNDRNAQIAAYNAGEGNVKKYGGVPPFKETRDYVKRVNQRYGLYSSGKDLPQAQKLQAIAPVKGATTPVITAKKTPAIPPMPKVEAKTRKSNRPKNLQANNQGVISQNVSDKGIAHAVTGGLGEDRWWG